MPMLKDTNGELVEPQPSRKGFTEDDIILLCTDVVRIHHIGILPDDADPVKKDSKITQKFKNMKNAMTKGHSKKGDENESPVQNTEAIAGLHNRDIASVSININGGAPATEEEAGEGSESSGVIQFRVPVKEEADDGKVHIDTQPLVNMLTNELDDETKGKLVKKVEKLLIKLHTTDISTARSFIKQEKYSNVRKSVRSELLTFLGKDMKLNITHDDK